MPALSSNLVAAWPAFIAGLEEMLAGDVTKENIRNGALLEPLFVDKTQTASINSTNLDAFLAELDAALREQQSEAWDPDPRLELSAIRQVLACAYAAAAGEKSPPPLTSSVHGAAESSLERLARETAPPPSCAPLGLTEHSARDLMATLESVGARRSPSQRVATPIVIPVLLVYTRGPADDNPQGVTAMLELEVVEHGSGTVYADSRMALWWCCTDFTHSIEEAVDWSRIRFDFRTIDVRWRLSIEGWPGYPSLEGLSAGGAFAFGLARVAATVRTIQGSPGFAIAAHLREIDPGRIALTAFMERSGELHDVGRLVPKIRAFQEELLARGFDTLIVAFGQDLTGFTPRGLRLERAKTLDEAVAVIAARSIGRRREILLLWLASAAALLAWADPGVVLAQPAPVAAAVVGVLLGAAFYARRRLPIEVTQVRDKWFKAASAHWLYQVLAIAFASFFAWYLSFLGFWFWGIAPLGVTALAAYVFLRAREPDAVDGDPPQKPEKAEAPEPPSSRGIFVVRAANMRQAAADRRKSVWRRAAVWIVASLFFGFGPTAAAMCRYDIASPLRVFACRSTDLRHLSVPGGDLRGLHAPRTARLDLTNANLEESKLHGAVLVGALLERANLSKAELFRADLTDAVLTGARLTDTRLEGATMVRARLENATLVRAQFDDANLTSAVLSGAGAPRADFTRASLTTAMLTKVCAANAQFIGTRVAGADLGELDLSWTDVSRIRGLEVAQLEPARGNDLTGLPVDMQIHCACRIASEKIPYAEPGKKVCEELCGIRCCAAKWGEECRPP